MKNTAIILIHCPDKKGIVAAVTDFLYKNNGNVIDIDEYVDRKINRFFMRVEWELEGFAIEKNKIKDYFKTLIGDKFGMEWTLHFTDKKPRMAIFVSKFSHCFHDILYRANSKEWNVDIPLIISNHPDLKYIADHFNVPFYVFPITKENKLEQEAKQLQLLKEQDVDFIVLARYMQIVTDQLINKYPNKIINIHHSFLPAFIGAKPYHQAYKRGVKIIGATSHYVTTNLDAGPIIAQEIVQVSHRDTIKDLIRKGKDAEKVALSRALWYEIQYKTLAYNNRTIIFD